MSSVFQELSQVNINDKTEKKGRFTYLSWAFAWGELKKVSPTAQMTVYHNDQTNMPYFSSTAGVMVKVGVTVDTIEHISYLPVMDFKNNAISEEKVNMMDINKAIQRAGVKAIALHGLGLYIYAGEDLPEAEKKETAPAKKEEVKTEKKKPNPASSFRKVKEESSAPLKPEAKTASKRRKGF